MPTVGTPSRRIGALLRVHEDHLADDDEVDPLVGVVVGPALVGGRSSVSSELFRMKTVYIDFVAGSPRSWLMTTFRKFRFGSFRR